MANVPTNSEIIHLLREGASYAYTTAKRFQESLVQTQQHVSAHDHAMSRRDAMHAAADALSVETNQPARRGQIVNECDVNGDGWHHIGKGSRCQCGVFGLVE